MDIHLFTLAATGNPWRLCFGSTGLACCLGGAFLFQQKDDILPDSTSFWNECQESLMFFWIVFGMFLLLSLECQKYAHAEIIWQTFLDQKLPIQSTNIVCEKEDSSAFCSLHSFQFVFGSLQRQFSRDANVEFHFGPPFDPPAIRFQKRPVLRGGVFGGAKVWSTGPWSWEMVVEEWNSNGWYSNGWMGMGYIF